MQYGCMHRLRVSGWVAVIIAAPAVLTIGVAAAHRASAPPRSPRVGGTAPAVNSHPTVAGLLTVTGAHDDVAARDVCADMAHADALVGVYFNSGGADDAGCVTAYDPARSFAAGNLRLAGLMQSDVLAAMNAQGWQIPDGGVQPDEGLGSSLTPADLAYGHLLLLGPPEKGYFITPSMMPGALVESLFITDPFEGSIAASRRGQQIIAGGLARAIEQYFVPQPAP
jgi:hypothetical protein